MSNINLQHTYELYNQIKGYALINIVDISTTEYELKFIDPLTLKKSSLIYPRIPGIIHPWTSFIGSYVDEVLIFGINNSISIKVFFRKDDDTNANVLFKEDGTAYFSDFI